MVCDPNEPPCGPKPEEKYVLPEPDPPIPQKLTYENRNIGITIFPKPPPSKKPEKGPNAKYLEYLELMSQKWRIVELAKPKRITKKYTQPEEKDDSNRRDFSRKLPDHVLFFQENLALQKVRILNCTKKEFSVILPKRWIRKMDKTIHKSWNTIYNYYNKKLRSQKLFQLKRQQQQGKSIKKISKNEFFKQKGPYYEKLAKPKELPKPQKKVEKEKKDVNYEYIEDLAVPKERFILEPRDLPFLITDFAKKYVATERIIKLSRVPMRLYHILPPLVPGKVKRSALKYVPTERLLKVTEPIVRHCDRKVIEVQTEADNVDCFKVKPSALKYKVTPRIKKLAEPKERK